MSTPLSQNVPRWLVRRYVSMALTSFSSPYIITRRIHLARSLSTIPRENSNLHSPIPILKWCYPISVPEVHRMCPVNMCTSNFCRICQRMFWIICASEHFLQKPVKCAIHVLVDILRKHFKTINGNINNIYSQRWIAS